MAGEKQTSMPIHTTHTRDAALRQLRRANSWLIAGSVALTGAFTAAAASAFPGRKTTSATKAGEAERSSGKALSPPSSAPRAAGEQTREAGSGTEAQSQSSASSSSGTQSSRTESSGAETQAESTQTKESAPAEEAVVSGGS